MLKDVNVKMIDPKLDRLKFTGDWVDVRISSITELDATSEQVSKCRTILQKAQVCPIKAGESIKIAHGFALELPKGYEAILHPRSSLFKKTGLIFVSSGVIDEGYRGDTDEWFSVWYATRDTELFFDQRIAQFRIQEKQPDIRFNFVESLGNSARGGHGSTGDF
jgi:dUTP pyrophosphatase|nr:MAG TPA: dUTPase [Caudoviricetes sp.]